MVEATTYHMVIFDIVAMFICSVAVLVSCHNKGFCLCIEIYAATTTQSFHVNELKLIFQLLASGHCNEYHRRHQS